MQALIFDMTNTLMEFDFKQMRKEFKKLLQLHKKTRNVPLQKFMKKYQKFYELYRLSKIKSDTEFLKKILKEFNIVLSKKELIEGKKQFLECRKNYVSLARDLKKILSTLKKKYKLALLSNGVGTWAIRDWKMLGFNPKKYFSVIHYSQFTHTLKPSKKAYLDVLRKLKVKPGNAFLAGNTFKKDIVGAKKAGLKTIYLNKKRQKIDKRFVDFEIKQLKDLLKIL